MRIVAVSVPTDVPTSPKYIKLWEREKVGWGGGCLKKKKLLVLPRALLENVTKHTPAQAALMSQVTGRPAGAKLT